MKEYIEFDLPNIDGGWLIQVGISPNNDIQISEEEIICQKVDAIPLSWLQSHVTTIEQQMLLDEWEKENE